jgi:hypothetical protein
VQVGAFRAATQVDSIKITKTYLRNSMLQLATIFAFMYGLGGTFVGGFVGGILGATMAPVVATLALAFLFFRRRACRQL